MIHPSPALTKRTAVCLLLIGVLACASYAQEGELKTQARKQENAQRQAEPPASPATLETASASTQNVQKSIDAGSTLPAQQKDCTNCLLSSVQSRKDTPQAAAGDDPSQFDLIATRAYLRTGPNSGSEVDNPVTGQQYFVHFDWSSTFSTPQAVAVQILLNNNVLCAGTLSVGAASSVIAWCAAAVTWPAGTNTIAGRVDSSNSIMEINENDNTVSKSFNSIPSPLPDMVADRVFLRTGPNSGPEVENPIIGQQYFVHFNWRNTGVAASGFRFNIRLNNNEICAYNGNAAANSSHNSWCTDPVTWPADTNSIQGVLDFQNVILEISESNNIANKTFISVPPPLPDMVADRVFLRTGPNSGPEVENPITGQQYFVHFNWRNIGTAASGFRFNIRLNNNEICAYNGNAAANSLHNSWCTDPITWPAGTNAIQGVLDFQNVIVEISEGNNIASKTLISIPPQPDLVADRVFLRTGPNSGLEVNAPIPGQSYFVHFEWRNPGGAADTFLVQIKLNNTVRCSGSLTAPANSSSVSWCASPVAWPNDDVTVEGLLDVNNSIAESNESNNNARRAFGDLDSDFDKSSGALSENAGAVPTSLNLYQSYPNPFGGRSQEREAIIRFDLPGAEPTAVELAVYNVTGQLVRRLISEERKPGAYETRWDGKDEKGHAVPSGTYLYRLKAGNRVENRQLTVVR